MTSTPKRLPIPARGVDYRGKVVLAPMVRSGELPSRLLALHYGADLVWGESKSCLYLEYSESLGFLRVTLDVSESPESFGHLDFPNHLLSLNLSELFQIFEYSYSCHYCTNKCLGPETVDRSMIGTTRKVNTKLNTIDFTRFPSNGSQPNKEPKESLIYRLHPEREGKKLIFQMGTANPERAVEAARLVAADVAGIDVNAGCPKPFSTSGGMGAALLRTPDLLCSILRALVENIVPEFQIGISVKIRLLETPEMTEDLVRKLVATGITGLTIHCRTTPMRPREKAIRDQLKMIGDVCREAGVACLMNGDVTSRAEAMLLAEQYGVDGGMIATAAEANPSVFTHDGSVAPWRELVAKYLKTALEVENRWGNTKFILQHLVPGKDKTYKGVTGLKGYQQAIELFGLDDLVESAKEVDEVLGVVERQTADAAKKAKVVERQTAEAAKRAKKQNQSALAAGGGSTRNGQGKKKLSERGVTAQKKPEQDQKPEQGHAQEQPQAPQPEPQQQEVSQEQQPAAAVAVSV